MSSNSDKSSARMIKFEEYKKRWSFKKNGAIQKELGSMNKWLSKNRDTFFHDVAPDELTDGLRVLALQQILWERSEIS